MTSTPDSPDRAPASENEIPYTHWAYFGSRKAAEDCGAELTAQGFLTGVDTSPVSDSTPGGWLLRAAKPVDIGELDSRHAYVQVIVESHDGFYDGGESGWLDLGTGAYLHQEPPAPGGNRS